MPLEENLKMDKTWSFSLFQSYSDGVILGL